MNLLQDLRATMPGGMTRPIDRGGRRSGRKRPLLADIRQTTNSVNPLYAVSDLSLAASSNGRTVRDAGAGH
jgi:hypothetical protein